MTHTKIVDNRNRPAQPEPDEDEAIEKPPSIREEGETEKGSPAPVEEDPANAEDTPLRLAAGRPSKS